MNAATAQREHGHVRIKHLETHRLQPAVQHGTALHRQNPVVAQGHQVDSEVPGLPVSHVDKLEPPVAQPGDQPVLQGVEASDQESGRQRNDESVHVDKLARDRRHLGFPPLLAHPVSDLFGAFLLRALATVANQHAAGLKDDEVTPLEVAGCHKTPDRNVVVLVELDCRHVVGSPALQLHVADQRSPGCHGA